MDPMERLVANALEAAGIEFRHGNNNPVGLDFYLPEHDLHIEVKRFHSDRIAGQMARADNVIAVQSEAAVRWLCDLITKEGESSSDNWEEGQ